MKLYAISAYLEMMTSVCFLIALLDASCILGGSIVDTMFVLGMNFMIDMSNATLWIGQDVMVVTILS